jgi:hypothetical protein
MTKAKLHRPAQRDSPPTNSCPDRRGGDHSKRGDDGKITSERNDFDTPDNRCQGEGGFEHRVVIADTGEAG